VVPKFIPDAAGEPGAANDLRCSSIEHKLGIHASPTCVMSYGDNGGALGWLVGEPHNGLAYMFVMMNAARLGVGMQGIGLAEHAFQQSRDWARTRIQGRPAGASGAGAQPIIGHPDVRRMLLVMKSGTEAMRALALYAALQLDLARASTDATARATALARGELLIPVVKGWSTEYGFELVSLGVQVHGGMGYIEETGIAQTLRDARITAIYEGTTAIQANDLVGRKLARDRGAAMTALLDEADAELAGYAAELPAGAAAGVAAGVAATLAAGREGLAQLRAASAALQAQAATQLPAALAVGVPYLRLCGFVLGGWLMARAAAKAGQMLAAGAADKPFLTAKLQTSHAYAVQVLPEALALARVVVAGGAAVAEADAALI
jgi:acyl-CoA dehydrogenase